MHQSEHVLAFVSIHEVAVLEPDSLRVDVTVHGQMKVYIVPVVTLHGDV